MILHVDMDAYYASIEERERPELKGRPLVVGGTPEGRGVVAAANYVARRFGIHSAMPAVTARRLCPHAVFLPCRMSYYAEVSEQIGAVFRQYTPLVEPLSLDEAFLDVSGCRQLFGSAESIGRRIKNEIAERLQLVASVGVAPNKFLAKVASDLDKPDGFVIVDPQRVREFLDPLPVERLWGVGKVARGRLQAMGIRTIKQLRQSSLETLQRRFGAHGEHLFALANGRDDRRVVAEREAKSISHETTFPTDIDDPEVLRAWLMELTEQVAWRLRRRELRGRTVQLKVRFADFRTVTRARTLPAASDVTGDIWQAASELLDQRLPRPLPPVRLIGVGVGGLEHGRPEQPGLFPDESAEAQTSLDHASDAIRDRFGSRAVGRASRLLRDPRGS